MSLKQEEAAGPAVEAPTADYEARHKRVLGLQPLTKARKAKIKSPDIVLRQVGSVLAGSRATGSERNSVCC